MDGPSAPARAVIASYRRARRLDDDARARVRERLHASIDAPIPIVRAGRRRVVTIAAIALATAAAVILGAQWLATPSQHAELAPRPEGEAVYGKRDATASERIVTPAEPPRSVAEPPTRTTTDAIAPPAKPPLQRPSARTSTDTLAPAADTLAAEKALISAAREALARGDHATALAKLADHAREFPRGQLTEERAALRVEALCAGNKRAQGRAEAQLFLRDHPGATQAARVAAACE